MAHTAKLVEDGRGQAVRLPKEYRFEGEEVAIRRDEHTGEVILSALPAEQPTPTFEEWFALYDALPDDAPESEFAKLPPAPRNLTLKQLFRIFDRAQYPGAFFERHTSMPRPFDLL